jgi:hypothetical protein
MTIPARSPELVFEFGKQRFLDGFGARSGRR